MQTANLAPGLESLGHEVAVFPFWGLQGGLMQYKGRLQYPIWGNEWGNDAFMHHAAHFRADVVITLMDTWVMHDDYGKFCKWLPWTPIDHQPVPQKIVEHLKTATRVIAFSKFGQEELKKVGINADYIPHGVDINAYKPLVLPNGQIPKGQFKQELGFPPDCFLVGMVAANKGYPSRKSFPENFEAFAEFAKKHPDARLYCHSEPSSRYGGPDLQGMAKDYGISHLIRFPNPYLLNLGFPLDIMCRIYNAFDVLLATSMGEGFGVPCIEAEACGIPIIVTNFASSIELCAAGWLVDPSRRWWTPLNSWQALPNIDLITDALMHSYEADRITLGKRAREFAMDYRWEKLLVEGWKPLLEKVEPLVYQPK